MPLQNKTRGEQTTNNAFSTKKKVSIFSLILSTEEQPHAERNSIMLLRRKVKILKIPKQIIFIVHVRRDFNF